MFDNFNFLTLRSIIGLLLFFLISGTIFANDVRLEFFEKKIRPVLVAHCYECHSVESSGKGKLKGGLALDTRNGLLKGGESGASIIPGKPTESMLIKALKYSGLEMPPTQKLSPMVIADFEKWIKDGAFDPREGAVLTRKQGLSIEEGKKFWSFIPPKKSDLPKVLQTDWPSDPIDFFVLSKMENQKLAPSRSAEGSILVRRLYYDLIGLPPTESEKTSFLKAFSDNPEKAKADLIDSLLSSHHFGEKWGRHWLDVVRYADSNG
ncbi:MAG: DUF1549 domain-containing protein, partial [Planctomycetes bacterium]|nr:DUF1549 domain-containing protein [Planctomycetota bacterium]